MSNTMMKPLLTGAVIVAVDKFVLKQTNMNNSLYFGLAGAVGIYAGSMLASMVPLPLPSGEYFDGKTLELRIAEITIGAGAGYAINAYVLKNDFNKNDMIKKLAVLAGSDFVAEYIDDYLSGRVLSFFK